MNFRTEITVIYMEYEIFIEPNPDRNRGGFVWTLCRDGAEIQTGLEFTKKAAFEAACRFITELP